MSEMWNLHGLMRNWATEGWAWQLLMRSSSPRGSSGAQPWRQKGVEGSHYLMFSVWRLGKEWYARESLWAMRQLEGYRWKRKRKKGFLSAF